MAAAYPHTLRGAHSSNRRHLVLRLIAAVLLVAGAVLFSYRHGDTREQVELRHYVQLTVPLYLEALADGLARFESLSSINDKKKARETIIDEINPRLLALRKRASAVIVSSPSARASNQQFLAAVDLWIAAARVAVHGIDDDLADPEQSHRALVAARRSADDAVRAWMADLRATCEKAGFTITL